MSWLDRHFGLDQLPNPQQQPLRAIRGRHGPPLSNLPQQIRSAFLRSSTPAPRRTSTSAPSATITRPVDEPTATTSEDVNFDEPPPPYYALFPQGIPVTVTAPTLELGVDQIPPAHQQPPRQHLRPIGEPWDLSSTFQPPASPRTLGSGRGARHARSARGKIATTDQHGLGIDASKFITTRIDVSVPVDHFYILTPRVARRQGPQQQPRERHRARMLSPRRVQSPQTISISESEDVIDYSSPMLHRLPSMADSETRPRIRIDADISETHTTVSIQDDN